MKILALTDTHCGFGPKTHLKLEKYFNMLKKDCEFDIIVHSGDWISHKQKQWKTIFSIIRRVFPDIPIMGVMGNHDRWNYKGKHTSVAEWEKVTLQTWKDYRIRYLPNEPYITDEVEIYGFDGWYQELDPPTNDKFQMKFTDPEIMRVFSKRSNDQATKAIESLWDIGEKKKKIVVTHFNIYGQYREGHLIFGDTKLFQYLRGTADLVIEGHTHRPLDVKVDGTRIVNVGSDYEFPNFLILDTENL